MNLGPTVFDRRKRCDHAGSGNGTCPKCGASLQRKWLELAAQWMQTASMAVARAEECAEWADDAATAQLIKRHRLELLARQHAYRETCIILDGFDHYAVRDRIDRDRARMRALAKVREGIARWDWCEQPARARGPATARYEP